MKKIILILITQIFCLSIFAKDFSIPTTEEIRELYPTLKETTLGVNTEDPIVFYSEKYVIKDEVKSKYYDEALLFKGIPEARISRVLKYVNFWDDEISNPMTEVKKIIITDNGIIYVYGKYKEYWISTLVKFQINDNKIIPIEQPFYCVDKNQITKESFYIKKDPNENAEKVALIAKNSNIKVIGIKEIVNKETEDWVLIQSSLGLIGWAKVIMLGEYNPFTGQESFLKILNKRGEYQEY